ncbi:MAG: septation protein SpoVG family protein [Planctomycetes bacterium]|nr:septation protein SpoVG family protein [Planctomycetota bacterium]
MTRRDFPPAMVPGAIVITGVEVFPSNTPSKVVAMVRLTLNDLVKVDKARLVMGQKGLFLSMPAAKNPETGDWEPFVDLGEDLHGVAQKAAIQAFRDVRK